MKSGAKKDGRGVCVCVCVLEWRDKWKPEGGKGGAMVSRSGVGPWKDKVV